MIWIRRLLLLLLLFQGATGILGGVRLVADPSGEGVGLSLDLLEGSAFSDYLVPGLVLFIVLGVGPLLAAYGVWRRHQWGWTSSFVVGAALIIWLAIQVRIIGYHSEPPLQLVYAVVASAIAVLAVLSGRQQHGRIAP
jgi:FtsH-binding integral membrane protein